MTDAATDASTATGSRGATDPNGAPERAAVERPGSLPTRAESAAAAKDRTLTSAAAVERARSALYEITEPLSVGEHTAAKLQAERLVTHLFECNLAGYDGWRWAATMARPPRSRTATVCELELLPGEDALLAPPWVPWADRLRAGDVGRSDRLPKRETDERLEPGWEASGEEGDAIALDELDLGRARVLSSEGIQRAAQRWYDGEHGPEADGVSKAHATCSTCGFLLPIAGRMRHVFGVCANELAIDDGRVVSLDHGCGAHSETDLPDQGPEWPVTPSYMDDRAMEPLGTDGASIRHGSGRAAERADAGDADASGTEGAPEPEEQVDAEKTRRSPARTSRGPGRRRARRSTATAPVPAPGEDASSAHEETETPSRRSRSRTPPRPRRSPPAHPARGARPAPVPAERRRRRKTPPRRRGGLRARTSPPSGQPPPATPWRASRPGRRSAAPSTRPRGPRPWPSWRPTCLAEISRSPLRTRDRFGPDRDQFGPAGPVSGRPGPPGRRSAPRAASRRPPPRWRGSAPPLRPRGPRRRAG